MPRNDFLILIPQSWDKTKGFKVEKKITLQTKHIFREATINRRKSIISRVCVIDLKDFQEYRIQPAALVKLVEQLDYAPITYSDLDENNKRNIIEILASIVRIWKEENKVFCDLLISPRALKNLLFDMAEKSQDEYPAVAFVVDFTAEVEGKTIKEVIRASACDIVAVENKTTKLFESHIHKFEKEGGRELAEKEKQLREKTEVKIATSVLNNAGLPVTELNIKRVRFCDNKQSLYQILQQLSKQYGKPEIEDEDDIDLGKSREERYEALKGTTVKGRSDQEWVRRLKESKKQESIF